jgi:hypothetical protein
MRLPTLAAAALALLASIHAARATPPPPLNVPAQIEQSDLIVVGRYSQRTKSGTAGGHAWIRTDRVLKGHLAGDGVMVDLGTRSFFADKPFYGMFFLQKTGNTYSRIDHGRFALVASPTAYLPRPTTTDPLTLAAWEFVNVYLMPESTAINPKTGLRDGMSWGGFVYLDKNGDEVVDESVPTPPIRLAEDVYDRADEGLRSIPWRLQQPFLQQVLQRAHGGLGPVWAFGSMIAGGDLSFATQYHASLMQLPPMAGVTAVHLMISVESMPELAATVSFLAPLLKSSERYIREGAAERLSLTDTPEATLALQPALDDPATENRRQAIRFICANTGLCTTDEASTMTPQQAKAILQR